MSICVWPRYGRDKNGYDLLKDRDKNGDVYGYVWPQWTTPGLYLGGPHA